MKEIPKMISEAGIFKPGDVYIFSEIADRGWPPSGLDILYIMRCEKDILLGLEFDIRVIPERKLLEITSCERLSELCFKLVANIIEGKEEKKWVIYLHRLITVQESIAGYEKHGIYSVASL